jgi:hypothetical protein
VRAGGTSHQAREGLELEAYPLRRSAAISEVLIVGAEEYGERMMSAIDFDTRTLRLMGRETERGFMAGLILKSAIRD